MASRAETYREELRQLQDWEPYLKKHSGLPGPRANLELVAAVADEADADRLWRLSASQDEFLALCGTAGLGRIALLEPATVMSWLSELASDPRWRVREGVAMALQRLGRESMPKLLAEMKMWRHGNFFVQRALVAGLCEPALLASNEDAVAVLQMLDQITHSVAASDDRRNDGFRVLRRALGYGWSVAAAAAPRNAQPYLEKWLRSSDKDVAWIMQSNLSKARMSELREALLTPEPKRRASETRRKRGSA
ncbi:MAG TPA: HEAT repeat domain-containing protein [Candidatus Dormibacteraeota bacterium]